MVNPKGNPQNLKRGNPETQFSGRKAVESGRKGAKASQKKQAELRTFKECYKTLLSMTIGELREKGITLDSELEAVCTDDMTVEQAITSKQITMALFGSHQAYEHIRDQIGEKPIDKQEMVMTVKSPSEMSRQELEDYLRDSMTDRP